MAGHLVTALHHSLLTLGFSTASGSVLTHLCTAASSTRYFLRFASATCIVLFSDSHPLLFSLHSFPMVLWADFGCPVLALCTFFTGHSFFCHAPPSLVCFGTAHFTPASLLVVLFSLLWRLWPLFVSCWIPGVCWSCARHLLPFNSRLCVSFSSFLSWTAPPSECTFSRS